MKVIDCFVRCLISLTVLNVVLAFTHLSTIPWFPAILVAGSGMCGLWYCWGTLVSVKDYKRKLADAQDSDSVRA